MSELLGFGGWLVSVAACMLAAACARERSRRREAVARAAHELRGPLQGLALGVALITERSGEHAGALNLELARARRALEDLQSAGRSGRASACATRRASLVDARGLMYDARRAAMPRAIAAGTLVEAAWTGPPAAIWGEPVRLLQALDNLVANAIEHGAGPVLVRGRRTAAGVRLEVCDHGAGLPAAVDALTRRARAGRGSRGRGLAIAREIARAHGGRLAGAPAESGARLILELPAVPAPNPSARGLAVIKGRDR